MLKLYFTVYVTVLISCLTTFAQTSSSTSDTSATKILFIGNSFTASHDMPKMFEELTKNTQHSVYVDKYTRGGTSLYEMSQNEDCINKIKSLKWDFIILQDSPYRFAYPMEFSSVNILTDGLDILKALIIENDPETEIILFMPWAYKDGKYWEIDSDDYSQMQVKVYEYAISLAKYYNFKIAPVGWAWHKIVFVVDNIELFFVDFAHATVEGAYLTACVMYSTIFTEQLINNPFIGTIQKETAEYLQSIASITVFDELENWNLLTNISPRITDSFMLHQNYPNPFNPQTTITFSIENSTHVKLEIFNSLGERVDELINQNLSKGQHSVIFDANNLPNGIYYYRIQFDNFSETKKMVLLK